jgi:hypothetical protein
VKGRMKKNEYQIEKDGQITIVNSKEEYEEFKTKYNTYDFMIVERVNKVETVKKPMNGGKRPKKISKLDLIMERLDKIEEILMRHEAILNEHSEIFKRNNLS